MPKQWNQLQRWALKSNPYSRLDQLLQANVQKICTRNFPISDLFTIDTWYTFHRKLSFSLTQNITQQMVLLNLLLVTFSRLLWNRDFIHAFKLFSINSYCASYSGSHIENWHSIMRMGLLNASGTKHQVLSLIFISIHRIIECEPLHRMYCRHFSH